jgi:hypothetical protein
MSLDWAHFTPWPSLAGGLMIGAAAAMLLLLNGRIAGVSVRYELASVYEWAWPAAAFDLVAAIFVQFADPPMRRFLFERMVRALRPGGLVLVEGYTPKQLQYATGGPKQLDQLYTEEQLRREFGGLEVLEVREYEAELDEGSRHQGLSAVIDFVARKDL